MKHDWEYKKLGEVCDVSAGQGAPQGEQSYCEKGTPFIKAGNLEDLVNGLDEGSVQNVSQSIAQKHKLKLYKAGSVLFAKSGMSCMKGYVHVLQRDCYVVSHLAILTPQTIDGHFLKYYLRFTKTYSLVKDEAYPSISLSDIASFPVPVPPLPTQRAIVAELDTLNEILDKKRQQLKELDTLAQSIFYDMFGDPVENEKGWEVKSIKELGEVKIGPFGSLLHKSDYITGGIPLVNPIHMKGDRIIIDSDFTVSKEKSEELSSYRLKEGDFVFARRGEIGRCAVVGSEEDGCICGTGSLFVRFKSVIDNLYLLYVVKSKSFSSCLIDQAKGATMLNINCGIVERLEIPTPPLFLQQSFAQKIEAIEKQKELINASIKEVEMLFNARMGYYFGE